MWQSKGDHSSYKSYSHCKIFIKSCAIDDKCGMLTGWTCLLLVFQDLTIHDQFSVDIPSILPGIDFVDLF